MFDNLITHAIANLEPRIAALDPEALASVTETVADAPPFELRQMMAEAHASGKLPLSEANTLYVIAQDWPDQSVAARVVWLKVAAEIGGVA